MKGIFLNFHEGEYLAENPKIISLSMKESLKRFISVYLYIDINPI